MQNSSWNPWEGAAANYAAQQQAMGFPNTSTTLPSGPFGTAAPPGGLYSTPGVHQFQGGLGGQGGMTGQPWDALQQHQWQQWQQWQTQFQQWQLQYGDKYQDAIKSMGIQGAPTLLGGMGGMYSAPPPPLPSEPPIPPPPPDDTSKPPPPPPSHQDDNLSQSPDKSTQRNINNSRGRGGRGGMNKNRGGMNQNRGGMNQNRGGMNQNRGGTNLSRGGMNQNRGGMNQSRGGVNQNQGGVNLQNRMQYDEEKFQQGSQYSFQSTQQNQQDTNFMGYSNEQQGKRSQDTEPYENDGKRSRPNDYNDYNQGGKQQDNWQGRGNRSDGEDRGRGFQGGRGNRGGRGRGRGGQSGQWGDNTSSYEQETSCVQKFPNEGFQNKPEDHSHQDQGRNQGYQAPGRNQGYKGRDSGFVEPGRNAGHSDSTENNYQVPENSTITAPKIPSLFSLELAVSKPETKQDKPQDLEELSEAEKAFDAQFKLWEQQFMQWKDQNKNHPDKTQYGQYENKWESWREKLLSRREQMRKKREASNAAAAFIGSSSAPQQSASTSTASSLNQQPNQFPPKQGPIDNKQFPQGNQFQDKDFQGNQFQMAGGPGTFKNSPTSSSLNPQADKFSSQQTQGNDSNIFPQPHKSWQEQENKNSRASNFQQNVQGPVQGPRGGGFTGQGDRGRSLGGFYDDGGSREENQFQSSKNMPYGPQSQGFQSSGPSQSTSKLSVRSFSNETWNKNSPDSQHDKNNVASNIVETLRSLFPLKTHSSPAMEVGPMVITLSGEEEQKTTNKTDSIPGLDLLSVPALENVMPDNKPSAKRFSPQPLTTPDTDRPFVDNSVAKDPVPPTENVPEKEIAAPSTLFPWQEDNYFDDVPESENELKMPPDFMKGPGDMMKYPEFKEPNNDNMTGPAQRNEWQEGSQNMKGNRPNFSDPKELPLDFQGRLEGPPHYPDMQNRQSYAGGQDHDDRTFNRGFPQDNMYHDQDSRIQPGMKQGDQTQRHFPQGPNARPGGFPPVGPRGNHPDGQRWTRDYPQGPSNDGFGGPGRPMNSGADIRGRFGEEKIGEKEGEIPMKRIFPPEFGQPLLEREVGENFLAGNYPESRGYPLEQGFQLEGRSNPPRNTRNTNEGNFSSSDNYFAENDYSLERQNPSEMDRPLLPQGRGNMYGGNNTQNKDYPPGINYPESRDHPGNFSHGRNFPAGHDLPIGREFQQAQGDRQVPPGRGRGRGRGRGFAFGPQDDFASGRGGPDWKHGPEGSWTSESAGREERFAERILTPSQDHHRLPVKTNPALARPDYPMRSEWEDERSPMNRSDRFPTDKQSPGYFGSPLKPPPDMMTWKEQEFLMKPATVVDYGHQPVEPVADVVVTPVKAAVIAEETFLEPVQTFDYGHGGDSPDDRRQSRRESDVWAKGQRGRGRLIRDYDSGYRGRADWSSGRDWEEEDRGSWERDDRRRNQWEGEDYRGGSRDGRYWEEDRFNQGRHGARGRGRGRGRGSGPPNRPKVPQKTYSPPPDAPPPPSLEPTPECVQVEDLLCLPGRVARPSRIAIILRGPPGCGKSFVAKLIKDKEMENSKSAPRIICLDDYFMAETDKEFKDPETGRRFMKKVMAYEYEPEMEKHYRSSLLKAFKKTVDDGYFPFIILDCINDKISHFEEMWNYAKLKGFQTYVAEMDIDVTTCAKRNVHNRTLIEIEEIMKNWEPTPSQYPRVDLRSLLQAVSINDVEMEELSPDEGSIGGSPGPSTENPAPKEDIEDVQALPTSKWETMERSEEKLDRLDGLMKRKHGDAQTMEDWLQLPDDYESRPSEPGKKRVRWADLEERRQQERMRAIGFVVGQTDWSRMTDPTFGVGALTRTKYI